MLFTSGHIKRGKNVYYTESRYIPGSGVGATSKFVRRTKLRHSTDSADNTSVYQFLKLGDRENPPSTLYHTEEETITIITNLLDVYAPATFAEILSKSANKSVNTASTSLFHTGRFLIKPANLNYLTINNDNSNYSLSFTNDITTYKDILSKVFQAISDIDTNDGTSTLSSTNFRLDSNLHSVFSLDYDTTTSTIKLSNNWSKDRTSASGYLCFYNDGNYLRVSNRYKYDTSLGYHVIDTTFNLTDYYLKYGDNNLILVSTGGSQFNIYVSPLSEEMPDDFNPTNVAPVANSRVSINSYLTTLTSEIEGNTGKLYIKIKDKYKTQVTNIGSNTDTKTAAKTTLTTIKALVESQNNKLRYDTSIYNTFREGALNFILQTYTTGNGTIGQNTVPYVYYTCEVDASGIYHPFMCILSYGISDRPIGLADIHKPPGDGTGGGYNGQKVTRDSTMGANLSKIPLLDYGEISSLGENSTVNDYISNLFKDGDYTPEGYTVYNSASLSAVGVMIDGVVIFPVMNNQLNTAQYQAEISSKGHHVGRNLEAGLHYHADGHSANSDNVFNIYNTADYVDRNHPPIIGFGFDGIALYGKYETNYSNMDGYSEPLDAFGGHSHDEYGYHYHSHDVDVTEYYDNHVSDYNELTDFSVVHNSATPYNIENHLHYTEHVLLKGAWKGKIDTIPSFWEYKANPTSTTTRSPEYSFGQSSIYVGH